MERCSPMYGITVGANVVGHASVLRFRTQSNPASHAKLASSLENRGQVHALSSPLRAMTTMTFV